MLYIVSHPKVPTNLIIDSPTGTQAKCELARQHRSLFPTKTIMQIAQEASAKLVHSSGYGGSQKRYIN